MTPRARGRSLVWLVTGAFLLAAVVGAVLQALTVMAVVRPIEARESRARAELAVSSVAAAFAAEPAPPGEAALDSLLRRERLQQSLRPAVLVVRLNDGTTATWPPEFVHFLPRLMGDSTEARGGEHVRNEVIARRSLVRGPRVVGEVLALRRGPPGPGSRWPGWGVGLSPLATWVYLPMAALLSAALALLLVRLLASRLGELERLASRVAEGDLSARVPNPRGDEIGRVAEQLNRMAERLASAREELEANDRQRRQLFADITHELVTPLTAIRGSAETLLDPAVALSPDDRARYTRGVLEESRRLDRMIRDLFELSRLEAGASPLDLERLDWAALCRNTIERFRPRYAAAHLGLEWIGANGEAWVEADGLRLEQVLDNLLVNALRYVPAGGHVTVDLQRGADGQGGWRMIVRDDGPGLPEAELGHVFERFYRGDQAQGGRRERDEAGSGLGLAIVRQIVERHGGAVRARAVTPHGLAIEVVQLYQLAGEGAATVRLEAAGPAWGDARRDEVKEVLVNLLENARNAGARGIVVAVASGRLEVRDDGSGIPPDLLPRIFEPRFSTTTSGSGLGLAIVRRLVESWGGTVEVESAVGRGTTVVVRLVPAGAPVRSAGL